MPTRLETRSCVSAVPTVTVHDHTNACPDDSTNGCCGYTPPPPPPPPSYSCHSSSQAAQQDGWLVSRHHPLPFNHLRHAVLRALPRAAQRRDELHASSSLCSFISFPTVLIYPRRPQACICYSGMKCAGDLSECYLSQQLNRCVRTALGLGTSPCFSIPHAMPNTALQHREYWDAEWCPSCYCATPSECALPNPFWRRGFARTSVGFLCCLALGARPGR